MAVTVNSIESGGNILPVELVAYDMDGQEGLFVPNTAERTAMKEAAANIGGSFGTSISFARSASQQLVMDVTRGVLGGGSAGRSGALAAGSLASAPGQSCSGLLTRPRVACAGRRDGRR